jgi:hypothetical protein
MIVIASFTSMASPPFEGKPRPPKFQLYFHCNLIHQRVQVFCVKFLTVFQDFLVTVETPLPSTRLRAASPIISKLLITASINI